MKIIQESREEMKINTIRIPYGCYRASKNIK